MSVSGIGSSHALEWLQGYLSKAGSAAGSQPAATSQPSSDRASISREAMQLNLQASQASDPLQVSGVKGVQGRPHRQGGGQGGSSFVDQLAQSIMADLKGAAGGRTVSRTSEATAQAGANGGSLIDQLASKLAKDLPLRYQPVTVSGFAGTSSRSNMGHQVNRTA